MTIATRRVGSIVLTAVLGVSVSADQAPPLQQLMREKLETSQQILAAVVTSDWLTLERLSDELARIANDPAWTVLTTSQYARYSTSFLRATEDLGEAARLRDLETAPVAFVSLTLSCVQCHRYVARARIAD